MSTEAQINANQQNSQKSTGPRTVEGKAAVSQNAVKHGLFGSEAVIKGENQADFDLYRDEMLGELAPAGAMESMLAERFVSLSWRLRRLERMQNQAIDVLIERVISSPITKLTRLLPDNQEHLLGDQSGSGSDLVLGRAAIKDCANYRVLDRLLLYERRIENSMFKTMRELERLRLMRQMEEKAAEQQSAPAIPKACGFEAATQKAAKEVNLKKQSQFSPPLMGLTSFTGGSYENIPACGVQKNKPKQSQFQYRQAGSPFIITGSCKKGR
ncbi:MAG: hypothetical protein ACYS80_10355 [Planctomycetota bacterium]|jgi:hypothetical protein